MSRRRKTLSGEDARLWRKVAESLTPLPGRTLPAAGDAPPPAAPEPPAPPKNGAAVRLTPPPAKPKPGGMAALAPIDRKTRQRLASGKLAIDDRIDLHGMTQGRAHTALRGFLASAQARGCKMVLVITGKGKPLDIHHHQDLHHERGVLKRVVPKWLRLAEFRDLVLSVEDAHIAHGGEGALYVRLRRKRGAP